MNVNYSNKFLIIEKYFQFDWDFDVYKWKRPIMYSKVKYGIVYVYA